jgi:hypothetical protein
MHRSVLVADASLLRSKWHQTTSGTFPWLSGACGRMPGTSHGGNGRHKCLLEPLTSLSRTAVPPHRNLERQLAEEAPAVATNWWSVLPVLVAVPLLLVTPLVLPHLLGHAMAAHKAVEECFGEQCPMGQGM